MTLKEKVAELAFALACARPFVAADANDKSPFTLSLQLLAQQQLAEIDKALEDTPHARTKEDLEAAR